MTNYKLINKKTDKETILNAEEYIIFFQYNNRENYKIQKIKTFKNIIEDIIFYTASLVFMSASLYFLCYLFSMIDKITL